MFKTLFLIWLMASEISFVGRLKTGRWLVREELDLRTVTEILERVLSSSDRICTEAALGSLQKIRTIECAHGINHQEFLLLVPRVILRMTLRPVISFCSASIETMSAMSTEEDVKVV